MTPVEPESIVPSEELVVYAKNQPQYLPLPAQVRPDGRVTTRWRLSEEEKALLLQGEDIYLQVLTFGHPMYPILLSVGHPEKKRSGQSHQAS